MKKIIIIICVLSYINIAQSQTIEKFSIDSGGASASEGGIEILYTIGEVNVQEYSTSSVLVSEGFINSSSRLKINPVVYLQGPILNPDAASLMNDDLRAAGLIPTTSPYADNATCNASVFLVTGNNAIVDWVWVELRRGSDNSIISNAQSAFLQRDGDVVAIDGVSSLSASIPDGNYYVSVSHRNHLGIMSASSYVLNATTTIIDLTSNPNLLVGGSNAVVALSNGNFGAYSGDYDANDQIQNTDANSVVQLIGGTGYTTADMDANTQIQNTDVNALIQPNIGLGQQFNRMNGELEFLVAGITLTFANAQITNDGSDNFYEADILIASSEDFYVGSGQVYFDYNSDAFGDNISSNSAIEYSQPVGSILNGNLGPFAPAYKDFIQNDNTNSRVSLSFQQNLAEVNLQMVSGIQVTASPKLLFHIKVKYINAGENANVCFYDQGVFQDQFFTACGGTTTADCTNSPGEQITDDTYDCSGADVDTLSVEAFDASISTFNVYPNPTKNYITVDTNELIKHIELYNLLGELIIRNDDKNMIDLSQLSNGVYLLKIISEEGKEVVKRIIKR